jgi:hypothetical protein
LLLTLRIGRCVIAPECSVPTLKYDEKWAAIMMLPIAGVSVLMLLHMSIWFRKRVIQRQRKATCAHGPGLISIGFTIFYFLYLWESMCLQFFSVLCVTVVEMLRRYLTRTIFDVFNCLPTTPPDGAKHGYLQVVFEPCYVKGRLQMNLVPFAAIAMFFYTFGYPCVVAYILIKVCLGMILKASA